MSALKVFGLQGTQTLHQVACKKYGSAEEASHQLQLEARRRRYAATAPGRRWFPDETAFVWTFTGEGGSRKPVVIPRQHWETRDYIQWFEEANHLKRTGEKA